MLKPMKLELSEEGRALLTFLEKRPSQFTYSECANITGVNDLSRLRGYIYTCLKRLKQSGTWYKNVRGVGYKLIIEDEKNKVQNKRIGNVTTAVRKIDKDQDHIQVSLLSRDAKLEFTFNSARIGRMMEATSRKAAREIKREIGNADLPLPGKNK